MKTIVIIDDNTAIRHSLKRMLGGISNEGGSFKVYTSSNGVEGLGLIFTTKPDVIIIDLTLPKYSGREVIDYLVTNETLKKDSELIVVMHENSKYKESLPKEFKLIDKSKRNALNELDNHLRKVFSLKPNKEKSILNKSLLHVANQSDLLVESIRRSNILKKILLYPLWFLSQVMVSIYLGVQNITGRNIVDNNIVQEEEDNKNLRVRTYPTIATILATLLITFFQVSLFVSGGMVILNTRVESILALSQGEKGIEFIIEKESEFEYVAEEVEFKTGGVELKKQTREISVETGDEIEEVVEEPILQEQPIPDDTQEASLEIQQDDSEITVDEQETNQEPTPEELQPDTNDSPMNNDVLGVSIITEEYYQTTKPFIITKTPVTYTKLDEILERSSINTDESSTQTVQEFNDYLNTLDPTDPKKQTKLTYQLSPDKINWYYYTLDTQNWSRTENNWVSSNTIQEINEGIKGYEELFPEGNLYLKVFIHTDNETITPSLKEIVVERDTSILTNTDVEIPEDKRLEEEIINTLDFNQLEVSIFNASYASGNKVVLGKLLLKEKNKKVTYNISQEELENYEAVVSYENGREIGRTNLYLNQRGEIEFLLITPEADGGYVVANIQNKEDNTQTSAVSKPVENSTFTVDSTGDEADLTPGNGLCITSLGTCTLRAAIQEANALAGADNIYFNIPTSDTGYRDYDLPSTPSSGDGLDGDDYWTIRPASAYPDITGTITLDGSTQESNQGDRNTFGPDVEISNAAVNIFLGQLIPITSSFNKIVVSGNRAFQGNIIVTNSYIGPDVKGITGKGVVGFYFYGSTDVQIGTSKADGNVISGNTNQQIYVHRATSNISIKGNIIGLDPSGTIPVSGGVIRMLNDAGMINITFGGNTPDEGNTVNSRIQIDHRSGGPFPSEITIKNNNFGTDLSGSVVIPNTFAAFIYTGYMLGTPVLFNYNAGPFVEISENTFYGSDNQIRIDKDLPFKIFNNSFHDFNVSAITLQSILNQADASGHFDTPIIQNNLITNSINGGYGIKLEGAQMFGANQLLIQGNSIFNTRIGISNNIKNTNQSRNGISIISTPIIGGQLPLAGSLCNGLEKNCISNSSEVGIYSNDTPPLNESTLWADNDFTGGSGADTTGDGIGDNNIEQAWFGLFELATEDTRRTELTGTTLNFPANTLVKTTDDPTSVVTSATAINLTCLGTSGVSCPATGHTDGTLDNSYVLVPTGQTTSILSNTNNWLRITEYIYDGVGNRIDYPAVGFDDSHAASLGFSFDGNSINNTINTGAFRTIDGQNYTDRGEPWTDKPLATRDVTTGDLGRFQIMEVEYVDANPMLQEDGSYIITVDSASGEDNVSTCGFDQGEGGYSGGGCGGVDGLPDGKTSLREAIIVANNHFGVDTIEFNIPTSDPNWNTLSFPNAFRIPINGQISILGPLVIDGNSQTTFSGDTNLSQLTTIDSTLTTGAEIYLDFQNSPANRIPIGYSSPGDTIIQNIAVANNAFGGGAFSIGTGNFGNVTINNVEFLNSSTQVLESNNSIFAGITIQNSIFKNILGSVEINETPNLVFDSNILYQTDGLIVSGIASTNVAITNNTFVDNGFASIFLSDADLGVVENNTFQGGNNAIFAYTSIDNPSFTIANNIFTGHTDLAIDLIGAVGAEANDPLDLDAGPNDMQNYPTIDTVTYLGNSQYLLSGDLDAAAGENPFDIEICESYDHPSNHGGCLQTLAHVTANSPWSSLVTIPGSNGSDNRYLSTLATNTNGSTSEFSENFYLDTTNSNYQVADYNISLITPANNSTITDKTPVFDWNSSMYNSIINPDVTKYRIYLDNVLLAETNSTTTNYITTTDLSLGVHTWSVKAYNTSNTEVDTSTTYTFTVEEIPEIQEYTITPISPLTDTQLDDTTPIFDWEDTNYTLSPNDSIEYEIYIDDTLITTTTESELDCDNYTDLCTLTEEDHTWYVVAYVVTKDPDTLETLEREEIGRTQIQSFNILQTQELSLENIPVETEEESPTTEETNLKLLSDETLIATVPLAAISTVMLLTTLLSGNIQAINNYGVVGVLFGWVVRKRRKYTGIIKQKGTEKRIGLATIRVYRKEVEMNKSGFIEQSMSDLEGRYLIKKEKELEKQDYYVEVIAKGYKTQEIQVSQDRTKLPKVIELEREENINQRKIRVSIQHISLIIKVVDVLLTVVVIVGLIYTVYATIENPSILNYMLLVIYLVIVIGNIANLLIRKKIKKRGT